MQLTFLGTSAGAPTRTRNVTSQALRFDDGGIWMLDCGEATQHQIARAGLRPRRIERILVTHLHGDHCYGLFGMLSSIAIHGRTEPVEVIGPQGLRELLETVLRLSQAQLGFPLILREIAAPGPVAQQGAWTVSAWPMVHRIPSWGYLLREAPRPGRFHPQLAIDLGVPKGPLWRRLQDGEDVELPGGRIVRPADVCEPRRPGRSLLLLGDTADASGALPAALDVDLVVHEATYDDGRGAQAQQWGHSTAGTAGRFAAAVRARALIITHFSARYDDASSPRGVDDLVAEAQAQCPATRVLAARDLWTYDLE